MFKAVMVAFEVSVYQLPKENQIFATDIAAAAAVNIITINAVLGT